MKRSNLVQVANDMKFKIIHKTTNEIRFGEWDPEGLYFISKGGNVGWDEYLYWKPYEKPVTMPKIENSAKFLSINTPILFVEVNLIDKSGCIRPISVPLEYDGNTRRNIHFHPLVGRLPFWRCSFLGKVRGYELKVFQLSMKGEPYMELMSRFADVKDELCDVCLGFEPNHCHKCKPKMSQIIHESVT